MNRRFLDRYQAESGDVLNAILTNSRDCIKLLTVSGELEYVSSSAKAALGLENADDAVGKIWRNFWPDGERAKLDEAILSAAAGMSTRFEGNTVSSEGETRHWEVTVSPVRGSDRLISHLLAVSTDVTAQRAIIEQSRRRLETAEKKIGYADVVAQELRHRLKNQLAVIGAVAKLLAKHTDDAKEMALKLEDRLIALARAQDLLTVMRDEPIGARDAVAQIIRASGAGDRIEIGNLPDPALPDESVQQLALLLGELQTNALKHGALSAEGGHVRLSGHMHDTVLTLRWAEDCGRTVAPVANGGGGFQLIKRLGSAGGHQPEIAWDDHGIAVEVHVRMNANA